jgi:hypothetical protein
MIFSNNRTTKTWQIVSVILTVISITITVYSLYNKDIVKEKVREKLTQQFEKEINEKIIDLIEAQSDLAESKKLILEYEKIIDREKKAKSAAIFSMDSVIRLLKNKEQLVVELQNKIENEKPVILDVDDNEQLRIFLEWSSTIDRNK